MLVAEDGEQAFAILASKPHLDLMVTDFRLPGGISGVEIAEPAVKLRPDLKVIFISGYPAEILESGSPITRKAPILAKPFDLAHLARADPETFALKGWPHRRRQPHKYCTGLEICSVTVGAGLPAVGQYRLSQGPLYTTCQHALHQPQPLFLGQCSTSPATGSAASPPHAPSPPRLAPATSPVARSAFRQPRLVTVAQQGQARLLRVIAQAAQVTLRQPKLHRPLGMQLPVRCNQAARRAEAPRAMARRPWSKVARRFRLVATLDQVVQQVLLAGEKWWQAARPAASPTWAASSRMP